MSRPDPWYSDTHEAWITRASDRLKTLLKGPKNGDAGDAAWDAFCVHMAKLGQPVDNVCNLAKKASQSSWRMRYEWRFRVADRSTLVRSPARR